MLTEIIDSTMIKTNIVDTPEYLPPTSIKSKNLIVENNISSSQPMAEASARHSLPLKVLIFTHHCIFTNDNTLT